MAQETDRKQPFKDAIEVLLKGIPQMIISVIETVACETLFQGKYYSARWHGQNMLPTFARLSVFAVDEDTDAQKRLHNIAPPEKIHPVGVITLQLLPDGKQSLFRVPARDRWDILGDFDSEGLYFTHLLICLFTEFQRLGFVDFRKEKPPLGFRLPHQEKHD